MIRLGVPLIVGDQEGGVCRGTAGRGTRNGTPGVSHWPVNCTTNEIPFLAIRSTTELSGGAA
jgi:hypothetical protein